MDLLDDFAARHPSDRIRWCALRAQAAAAPRSRRADRDLRGRRAHRQPAGRRHGEARGREDRARPRLDRRRARCARSRPSPSASADRRGAAARYSRRAAPRPRRSAPARPGRRGCRRVWRHRPVERIALVLPVDHRRHPRQAPPRPAPRLDHAVDAASWRYAGWRCGRSRGPPSGRHRGCRAPSSSRRPGRSSARHSRVCPGQLLSSSSRDLLRAPVPARQRPGWPACPSQLRRRSARRARAGARRRRPGDSGWRAGSRRSGRGPRRCSPRPAGWAIFWSSMSAIRSGIAHMPLPICARPGEAAGEADVDIVVLIGLEPVGALHLALADHRARASSRCGSRRRCGRGSRC